MFSSSLYRMPDSSAVEACMLDMELTCSSDSPAMSFAASFVCIKPPGEIGEIHIQRDGETIFMGRVDKQRVSFGANGVVLRLECRSNGALLLDNEAKPNSYFHIGLNTFFARHIAPYGFYLINPNAEKRLPYYTVRKGQSEWEALIGFCEAAYGFTPHVSGANVILDRPKSARSGIVISNAGKGERFSALEYSFTPYNMISKIYLRDAMGSYSSVVENPLAEMYGVERKRYMIPPGAFMEGASADAIRRVKSSMLAGEEIKATLPGVLETELGQIAGIEGGIFEKYGFMVDGYTYKMDKSGYTTILKLIRTDGGFN